MQEIIEPEFNIEIEGRKSLGRGPQHNGWGRDENLIYKCVKCGDEMQASNSNYWNCKCGAVHLDYVNGRFGSKSGDYNILTYRKLTETKHFSK